MGYDQFIDMELNKKTLHSLIERAGEIHNKLNDEIDSSISFCKVCSEHGRYCDVAETSYVERERLIALRNSLKEVEDLLVHLQKLQFWQLIDRHKAFTCLENSRLYLMEQVTGYQGREVDVLKELNACFGNEKTAFSSNLKDKKRASPIGKKSTFSFFISCIKFCLDPRKWPNSVGVAAKLMMVSASISSTLHLYNSRQKYYNSQRGIPSFAEPTNVHLYNSRQKYYSSQTRIPSFVEPTNVGKINTLQTSSKSQLDVFSSRG